MGREPVPADLRPHVEALTEPPRADAPDRALAEEQIKDESRVGEDGGEQNPREGRAGRMARQHDAQRHGGDDEELEQCGEAAPQGERLGGDLLHVAASRTE